jgi:hypothetical protein
MLDNPGMMSYICLPYRQTGDRDLTASNLFFGDLRKHSSEAGEVRQGKDGNQQSEHSEQLSDVDHGGSVQSMTSGNGCRASLKG